jgi:hypothetical protein
MRSASRAEGGSAISTDAGNNRHRQVGAERSDAQQKTQRTPATCLEFVGLRFAQRQPTFAAGLQPVSSTRAQPSLLIARSPADVGNNMHRRRLALSAARPNKKPNECQLPAWNPLGFALLSADLRFQRKLCGLSLPS